MKRVVLLIIPALICGIVLTGCDSEIATDKYTKDAANKYDVYVAGYEARGQD
jgi:uncharacterized lipoprotein YehR (DUF1307 family)